MPEEQKRENTLLQQLADFKHQNPKVVEAMELFGISLAKYQETLNALYSPRIYQSTSTTSMEKQNQ
jgi:hypothetical protein